jgi:hypothetical protein
MGCHLGVSRIVRNRPTQLESAQRCAIVRVVVEMAADCRRRSYTSGSLQGLPNGRKHRERSVVMPKGLNNSTISC